jgi:hypothetical protein
MIVTSDAQAGVTTVDDPTWPNAGGHYQLAPADFSAYPNFTTQNYLIGDDGAGNKSLWVECGLVNGRMSYRKIVRAGTETSNGKYAELRWEPSFGAAGQWAVYPVLDLDTLPPQSGEADDTSIDEDDVATPDLATFGIYTFTTP